MRSVDRAKVEQATGLTWAQIIEAAEMIRASDATIYCWAMGLTQHRNAVATIREITNVALVRGDIGKRGAGLCPVRGHSNVQGDRTMGIWERPPEHFLDALQAEFGFDPPREHGFDTVDSIRALRDGQAHVFIGLGGNFVHAAPDTEVTRAGDDERHAHRPDLHQAQPVAPDLRRHRADPADARAHREGRAGVRRAVRHGGGQHVGRPRIRGPLAPASPHLRSEVAIVCGIAQATLGPSASAGNRWPPTTRASAATSHAS